VGTCRRDLEASFTDPLARSLAFVAIVLGGLMFMFGEGAAKRQISGIVFGGRPGAVRRAVPHVAVRLGLQNSMRRYETNDVAVASPRAVANPLQTPASQSIDASATADMPSTGKSLVN
jgi:hypothetical protein